jgi:hypothetical protein
VRNRAKVRHDMLGKIGFDQDVTNGDSADVDFSVASDLEKSSPLFWKAFFLKKLT